MSGLGVKLRLSTNTMWGLALTAIVGFAFFLRTYIPYNTVFAGDFVQFKGFDSWYHVRLVENLLRHFPQRIDFDPFTSYPHGQDVFFAPFYDLLLGLFTWVFGAGHPSTGTIETVAAYFPAILGALVPIPVFFIGKVLFNKKVGLIAAALIMIMPGQFLLRSLLGFTDHHVAETLFSSLTMLFLILAVKSSKEREVSFNSLLARDWGTIRKPLIYSILTGISLGLYLLSWVGGALLVFVIFVFAFIQYILDHTRGKSTDYLCIVGIPSLFIATLLVVPFLGQFGFGEIQIASLLIGILAFAALSALSILLKKLSARPAYYPLALALLGGISFAAFYIIAPSTLDNILDQFRWFNPGRLAQTIAEMSPITLSQVWKDFTTSFYLALISLVILAYLVLRERAADKTLLLIWSVTMLLAMWGQNRFAYYVAVNVSLLTAFLCWKTVELVVSRLKLNALAGEATDGSRKLYTVQDKPRKGKKAKHRKTRTQSTGWGALAARFPLSRHVPLMLISVALFFLVFYPNIGIAIDIANEPSELNQVWRDSLVWMRENTQDPFDDPDIYYETYTEPPNREDYDYPESAYGVMAWWDYGHWITYIARRIPNANPHQSGASEAAHFFTAQDESSANRILNELGSRYVIADLKTAFHEIDPETGFYGNFHAVLEWASKDADEFFDVYYQRTQAGALEPLVLYYPEYYRSMSSRLFNFKGEEVMPLNSTWVISYQERLDKDGNRYKEITEIANDSKPFATYESAQEYVRRHPSSNYLIVGYDQLSSPVPLEELEHYTLIYESPRPTPGPGEIALSLVKIFEYVP